MGEIFKIAFLCILLFLIGGESVLASGEDFSVKIGEKSMMHFDSVKVRKGCVYFPLASDSVLFDFRTNKEVLLNLAHIMQSIQLSDEYVLDSIVVIGSASPLGGETLNRDLARRRAVSLTDFIITRFRIDPSIVYIRNLGANWGELRKMVAASEMRYKKDVLSVIDNIPVDKLRNRELMNLKWGRPYREMMNTFFPDLQHATWLSVYYSRPRHREVCVEHFSPDILIPEPAIQMNQLFSSLYRDQETKPLVNISTNLAYWCLLAPNVGLEYCVPQSRWSFNGEFFMPWWKNENKHKFYQMCHYSVEPRIWLKGNGVYKGHFFGNYFNGGIYDLENGAEGYKGDFWGAGLTYGYLFRLKPNFGLELSVGAGYLSAEYEEYIPVDNHYVYQRKVRRGYIGPTKLKVGLVWTLVKRNKGRGR